MCQFPPLEHRDQRFLENASFPHGGKFLVLFLELGLPEVFQEENCKSQCSTGHLLNFFPFFVHETFWSLYVIRQLQ